LSEQKQDNENSAFHREGDALVFDAPPSPEEAQSKKRADEQHEFARDQVKNNRRLAQLTFFLVIGTFITAAFGYWQGSISQSAVASSERAVLVAQQSERQTAKANAQQRLDNAAAALDAKNLADKNAAQAAKALQATIDNFHQEQRAWVGVCDFRITSFETGKPIQIGIRFCNSGRTPAKKVEQRGGYRITPEPIDGPSVTNSNGLPWGEAQAVPPQGSFNMYMGGGTDDLTTYAVGAGVDDLTKYSSKIMSGELRIYFYGNVRYRDVYTNAIRDTQFCIYLANPKKQELRYCNKYNKMN
jgi:hypothetical protein